MKTIVACPLEGPNLESIKNWLKHRPLQEGPIDFVHIIKRVVYGTDLMQVVETPTPEQFRVFREAFAESLRHILFPLIPIEIRGSCEVHILLANDEYEEMVAYAQKHNPKLLVVGTRGLKGFKGLFTSSFATSMLKTAPCDVLILRPVQ